MAERSNGGETDYFAQRYTSSMKLSYGEPLLIFLVIKEWVDGGLRQEAGAEEGVAAAAVASPQCSDALLTSHFAMPTHASSEIASSVFPVVDDGALAREPCLRLDEFFPAPVAEALERELLDGLQYERVELGTLTAQWRASRPLGDAYFGPMQRRPGWVTPECVHAALRLFESPAFVEWLGRVTGDALMFLRPVTAYRLEKADRICLHDDMSDPSHAVSIAYNLSRDWSAQDGGCTVFGEVVNVVPAETPPDSPFPLHRWEIDAERVFTPAFNSLLVMRLGEQFAHGVQAVTGSRPRLSLVGIYGRL